MKQYQQTAEEFRRLSLLDENYEHVRRRDVDVQRGPCGGSTGSRGLSPVRATQRCPPQGDDSEPPHP